MIEKMKELISEITENERVIDDLDIDFEDFDMEEFFIVGKLIAYIEKNKK